MVQRVPGGVQEPSDAYEGVGSQPPVGEVGDHAGEGEFPHPEASSAQVGCAGARDEDGVELPPGGLLEQGTQRNVDQPDDGRCEDVHDQRHCSPFSRLFSTARSHGRCLAKPDGERTPDFLGVASPGGVQAHLPYIRLPVRDGKWQDRHIPTDSRHLARSAAIIGRSGVREGLEYRHARGRRPRAGEGSGLRPVHPGRGLRPRPPAGRARGVPGARGRLGRRGRRATRLRPTPPRLPPGHRQEPKRPQR